MMFISISAMAENQVCGVDLNGDGLYSGQGETASCLLTGEGPLCPIDSATCTQQQVCPIENGLSCFGGQCNKTHSCEFSHSLWFVKFYTCSYDNSWYTSIDQCQQECIETAPCNWTAPTCPLANGGACLDVGNNQYQCSETPCNDLDVNQEVEVGIDDRVYIDDGQKAADGTCLDTVMVFAGRNMECQKAGVSTAYQSCCKAFDMIMSDSTGSVSEMTLTSTAIAGTYEVAKSAYETYKLTQDIAETTQAAQNTALTAFDPTTLAISYAMSLAIDYFVNNCSQMDMETGILNASGRCYEVGEYCKKTWPLSGCVQEAKKYCCFNSKLAKIIHEQGRSQLQSFTGVSADDCRGFYPEEFQYLDFGQIDLSDYYGDLKIASHEDMLNQMSDKTTDYMDKVVNP